MHATGLMALVDLWSHRIPMCPHPHNLQLVYPHNNLHLQLPYSSHMEEQLDEQMN